MLTSGCAPLRAVRQAWHAPHPVPRSHCRAAAKASAAFERPDPGGPLQSHAWVMPCPATARFKGATAFSGPTSVDQTSAAVSTFTTALVGRGPPLAHGPAAAAAE